MIAAQFALILPWSLSLKINMQKAHLGGLHMPKLARSLCLLCLLVLLSHPEVYAVQHRQSPDTPSPPAANPKPQQER